MKDEILNEEIFWRKHPRHERYFFFKKNESIILLRINNFPDEPLYTVINGLEIFDIDDRPENWTLEEHFPLHKI